MSVVLSVRPLGFQWETEDPFLFCVHHDDAYPSGNDTLGPTASLAGREIGRDFAGKDGWRMYHGREVPGFPAHPHRGFETLTLVRRGLIDHSDSLGATARFGRGDAQWLTAGDGIVHAEMFPLVRTDAANPLELFQIWINLPGADKRVPAHFAMLWDEAIPRWKAEGVTVTVVAGRLNDAEPPSPPPHSWASKPDSRVAVWAIALEPGATWELPATEVGVNRNLYAFEGSVGVAGVEVVPTHRLKVRPDAGVPLRAGPQGAQLLLLQGRPIGEPVAAHGPFVMNTPTEIEQAYADYRRTRFGGWPWQRPDPVHAREDGRFARRPDGKVEKPVG